MAEGITFEGFVLKLVDALNNCGIEYLVVGGVAAIYYGRPRTTSDCDVIVSLEEAQVARFVECLQKHGFGITESDVLAGFREKGHFNAWYGESIYRADFSWKRGSLAEHGFARAKEARLFGVRARMEAPEDVIVAKLVYGSPQDLDDAKAIMLAQKNIDYAYLEKRAKEEGVQGKLGALVKSVKG